ncbi:hypothetical protein QBC46DRAFT_346764 [Diplogelasinospora grovesii]|uniref:Uncharacterized protein n=1 Tax=Diplogelasinospora grovesii TaxID=303347 RepID=A0AAN6RZ77_9PEZI|nr:hypothetical protein QBC46DRAFT_346764 [Diplogelasinospora grovesii]
MNSLHPLRAEYVKPTVNPAALGFLSIFLGGSVIHFNNFQEEVARRKSDWDGVGILQDKAAVVSLLKEKRVGLCDLLGIEKEDASPTSWEEALDSPAIQEVDWQVVRFSGWTGSGSKRTLKIWTQEHLEAITTGRPTMKGPCYLGLLSHKSVPTIQLRNGGGESGSSSSWGLVISHPVRVTDRVCVISDFDYFHVEQKESSAAGCWTPGVLCDLLLTAQCVFETGKDVGLAQKRLLWLKWAQHASNGTGPDPSLCLRWAMFPESFQIYLRSEAEIAGRAAAAALSFPSPPPSPSITTPTGDEQKPSHEFHTFRVEESETSCVKFIQYHRSKKRTPTMNGTMSLAQAQPDGRSWPQIPDHTYVLNVSRLSTPFSSNSICERATLHSILDDDYELEVLIKTAEGYRSELAALAKLSTLFDVRHLQRVAFVDDTSKQIYYEFFADGKTLVEVRFWHLNSLVEWGQDGLSVLHYRWLLGIECKRARDVWNSYDLSWHTPDPANAHPLAEPAEPRIHQYFHHRLHNNKRLNDFYAELLLPMKPDSVGSTATLDELLHLPLIINNRPYHSLRYHLVRAGVLLNPAAVHWASLPRVYGLGDGHSGNVLITDHPANTTPADLRYIDYEVAGHHPVVLDMAKPTYNDCFYTALWGDQLSPDLSTHTVDGSIDERRGSGLLPDIAWEVRPADANDANGEAVAHITYNLNMCTLDKAMGRMKFEGVVCRAFERIHDELGVQLALRAEDAFASALLCCAVLTRNFSDRPDLFFLNLALGIELAEDMRGSVERNFGVDLARRLGYPQANANAPGNGQGAALANGLGPGSTVMAQGQGT